MKYIFYYLIIMNIMTFILFALDKFKAKKGYWRISEKTLFGFSFMGGALGGLLAMFSCHHKTKTLRFVIGIPVMFIFHCLIFYYLMNNPHL